MKEGKVTLKERGEGLPLLRLPPFSISIHQRACWRRAGWYQMLACKTLSLSSCFWDRAEPDGKDDLP